MWIGISLKNQPGRQIGRDWEDDLHKERENESLHGNQKHPPTSSQSSLKDQENLNDRQNIPPSSSVSISSCKNDDHHFHWSDCPNSLYFEDFDMTRKFQKNSYKTIYTPTSIVFHEGGFASRKSLKIALIHIMSAIKYFQKWGWKF